MWILILQQLLTVQDAVPQKYKTAGSGLGPRDLISFTHQASYQSENIQLPAVCQTSTGAKKKVWDSHEGIEDDQ